MFFPATTKRNRLNRGPMHQGLCFTFLHGTLQSFELSSTGNLSNCILMCTVSCVCQTLWLAVDVSAKLYGFIFYGYAKLSGLLFDVCVKLYDLLFHVCAKLYGLIWYGYARLYGGHILSALQLHLIQPSFMASIIPMLLHSRFSN